MATKEKRLRVSELPRANQEDVLLNLSPGQVARTRWVFDMADPRGLWEKLVAWTGTAYFQRPEFLEELEALKKQIRASGRIDPVTVDPMTPWFEGHHRIRAAVDLGFESIPGYFRVR